MNTIALFTVVYPGSEKYLDDFKSSLINQSCQKFDLVVVNDGTDVNLKDFFDRWNVIVLQGGSSIAKNREIGINYVIFHQYDYLFLCDIDDIFAPDRIATSLPFLCHSDIVVNDVNILDENKEILCFSYFSKSITQTTTIDLKFILHKNILGFSNTSLCVNKLPLCSFPAEIKVVDWFYFTMLVKQGLKVQYIDVPLTGYRQHTNNLIGIDNFSISLFKEMLLLKEKHFMALAKVDPFFSVLRKQAHEDSLASVEEMVHSMLVNKKNNPYPLWWENIKIINI